MEDFKKVCMFFGNDDELTMESLSSGDTEEIFGDQSVDDDTPFEEEKPADADIDPEDIFDESNPQGNVGEEVDNEEEKVEQPDSSKEKGSSPKSTNSSAYQLIAKALKDDDVLPDLTDEFINEITSPDKFAEAIEKQVTARLESKQKRIDDALNNNVPVDEIKRFENALNYLDQIGEETLSGESDESENLRKQIIYQDYINKGFNPAKATKKTEASFNAGTDVEDAIDALESNKEHFGGEYKELIEAKEKENKLEKQMRDAQVTEFKKKVLETEEPFGIKVDKTTRQKMFENIVKPIHKDSDGKLLTAIQKYSKDNPNDSEYYFGLFYTMTDGFKNIDKFVGQKVKQGTKKSLTELEHRLKNTPLNGDGSVDFEFGNDSESFIGKKISF